MWNVSNGKDFSSMFFKCSSLSDIKALQKWDVSNGNNFRDMFLGCSSSLDVAILKDWKISKSHYNSLS